MAWSTYQTDIFDWIRQAAEKPSFQALVVEAVAGSGKTSTIVAGAELIPSDEAACFLAFNKAIATELGQKLPQHIESKTLNALGHKAVSRFLGGKVELDANKTLKLVDNLPAEDTPDGLYSPDDHKAEIRELVAKAKAAGMVPDGMPGVHGLFKATHERWATLMDRYEIDSEAPMDLLFAWCDSVLRAGLEDTRRIDFDDQLYMTVAFAVPTWKYKWVIVDEAQDVSHVQRAMIKKFLHPEGRLIAVGDTKQAIYGFRGADSGSMENIRQEFNAEDLPLSITYRCPTKVVEAARAFVPQIEAAEGAPEGEVKTFTSENPLDIQSLTDGDLVVCRNTKPLISLAYMLIGKRVPVNVAGRDIGKGLVNLVKKVGGKTLQKGMDMDTLLDKLDTWVEREKARAEQKGQEAKAETVQDKYESLMAIYDTAAPETPAAFIQEIEDLFNQQDRGAVTLSTVHRAKGLEAPRVYILEPKLMPSKYAKQPWQLEQEDNLMYVAYTRAQEGLYFLPGEALR